MLTKTDLFEILSVKKLEFQIHDHEALFTVEDSENLRGEIKGAHTKNFFLKDKKKQFVLFSCMESETITIKDFSKSIGYGNLSFANEDYLKNILGILPGSVSPFALLNDYSNLVDCYLEERVYKSEFVNFHPLVNTSTICINTNKFISFMIENNKKVNIYSLKDMAVIKTYE